MTPVVMIAGDGIGPEVMAATQKILQAAGARVDWIEALAGLGANDMRRNTLIRQGLESHALTEVQARQWAALL